MNARRLKNYWNFRIRSSAACSALASTATTQRSTASPGVSPVAVRWIELAPSRVAAAALVAVYCLAFGVTPLLQMPVTAAICIGVALFAHATWYRRRVARRARVSALGVEPGRGVVACRVRRVASRVAVFRVEHVFCYYLQICIRFADGQDRRLCIVGDRVGPRDFQYLCMCACGYQNAGWVRTCGRGAA